MRPSIHVTKSLTWQVQTLNSLPNFGEPGIKRNTVERYRMTDMTREDESFRRQRENLLE